MMDIAKSDIVKSIAGRDQGKYFFVLEAEGDFLILADGKTRKVETPKRKKRKHTATADFPQTRVAEKIRSGEKITNSELRRTLAQICEEGNPDQEG